MISTCQIKLSQQSAKDFSYFTNSATDSGPWTSEKPDSLHHFIRLYPKTSIKTFQNTFKRRCRFTDLNTRRVGNVLPVSIIAVFRNPPAVEQNNNPRLQIFIAHHHQPREAISRVATYIIHEGEEPIHEAGPITSSRQAERESTPLRSRATIFFTVTNGNQPMCT